MTVAALDVAAAVSQPGMASLLEWRAGPNVSLVADIGDLRLTMQPPARFVGEFRHSVLGRQYGRSSLFAEVEGGARERLHDAMAAAEQATSRLVPQEQHGPSHRWVIPVRATPSANPYELPDANWPGTG